MNFDIEKFLSLEGYDNEIRKARRKTGISSNEFFTPYSIVLCMCDKVEPEIWADPDKTFLEPCAGNFQFVLFILYRRIHEYNITWQKALKNMYLVELMQDNIDEGRARVHELLRNISPDYDSQIADEIMDKNLVCHDFFTWDFENWCSL